MTFIPIPEDDEQVGVKPTHAAEEVVPCTDPTCNCKPPVKCASPTYSPDQPELTCPYFGLYELNGKMWCEYHYLSQCTHEQAIEHDRLF